MPVGVEFDFVDQRRTNHIHPPDLNIVSRTIAQVRIHWKSTGSAECRKRIKDSDVVVDIPEIKTLLFIGVFINANDVLAEVKRVREVKCQARVGSRGGQSALHGHFSCRRVESRNGCAIAGDASGVNDVRRGIEDPSATRRDDGRSS